ncbi:helix-turn-helix transcriptional regulator [Lysinibacter sp. HNR]|uniref:response regulator transcription factor n=1 Tax=Lysinibacter sp. HNR TaxID=3031408 RepID=UPI0024353CB7|nr:helix-turn-helix transcriptional regulator [Lysinibacter sp. HNR]WGD37096.1 LuxR C-terminal-related transcriptional regulator [Lysinibacter sp. HNR]
MAHTFQVHTGIRRIIMTSLLSGTSVSLVGVRGSGRSNILSDTVQQLEQNGYNVIRIAGIRPLKDRPLEALHLAGILANRAGRSGSLISNTVDDLSEALSGAKPIIVIDDFDELDDASIGVIAAAHHRLKFPVLSSMLPGPRHLAAAKVLEFTPNTRLRMEPLRFDDIHALLANHLRGTIDTEVVSRVNAKSGGLPGLALAIVDTAQRENNFVYGNKIWTAQRSLWSESLVSTIEPLFETLSPQAFEALNKLALVGHSEVETTVRLIGWENLQELDEAHLLVFLPSHGSMLTAIYPPLVAEYFRRSSIGAQRLRLQKEITDALGNDANLMSAHADAQPDRSSPSIRESDAVFNLLLSEHWNSRVLLRRVEWEKSPTWETAAPYLEALLTWRHSAETVEHVLAHTRQIGDSESQMSYLLWEGRYQAIEKHDVAETLRRLKDAEARFGDRGHLLRLERIYLDAVLIGMPHNHSKRIASSSEPMSLESEMSRVYQAGTAIVQGRPVQALAMLERPVTVTSALSRYRNVVYAIALVCAGRLEEALEWSRYHLVESRSQFELDNIHAHSWTISFALSLQGRTSELQDHLSTALSIGVVPLMSAQFQTGNLAIAAIVAARQGRSESSHTLLEEAERPGFPHGHLPSMSPIWARSVLRSLTGDPAGGAKTLWTEAETLINRGYILAGVFFATASLEILPHTARLHTLHLWAENVDSPLFATLIAYVDALSSGDAAALTEIAADMTQSGLIRYSIRSYLAAARIHRSRGDTVLANQAYAEASSLVELSSQDFGVWLGPTETEVELTSREMDVARLVVEGLTNHEIAERLVLSVRTVESHLHRIFRKIGADNRQELISRVEPLL